MKLSEISQKVDAHTTTKSIEMESKESGKHLFNTDCTEKEATNENVNVTIK